MTDDFKPVPLDELDRICGGFLMAALGIASVVAPLIGKIVDASRKNGDDGKGTQIGQGAGQMFAGMQNMAGGGSRGGRSDSGTRPMSAGSDDDLEEA